ncbi:MAG: hypothetical protein R2715_21790 [Ilumatobacteraceae bacterium]
MGEFARAAATAEQARRFVDAGAAPCYLIGVVLFLSAGIVEVMTNGPMPRSRPPR